jgi:hypothetical protein
MTNQASIYSLAAQKLGWEFSQAFNGFINERYRNRPNEDPNGWGSYEVEPDAEQACFRDGIETEMQALELISA